eukprot:4523629-Pleurochrysis_carterae.AAC.1
MPATAIAWIRELTRVQAEPSNEASGRKVKQCEVLDARCRTRKRVRARRNPVERKMKVVSNSRHERVRKKSDEANGEVGLK